MSGVQDPRAAQTRARLRAALLEACAEQPLSDVSVAGVVQRAGIGRATFYLHYPALEELAVDACADVVREAVEALHAWRGIPDPATPPPPLEEFFGSLEQHRAVYTALMTPGGGGPLGLVLHRDLRERSRRERELEARPKLNWWRQRWPARSLECWPTGCTDWYRARRRKWRGGYGDC